MKDDDVMIELSIKLQRNGAVSFVSTKATHEIDNHVAAILALGMMQQVMSRFQHKTLESKP